MKRIFLITLGCGFLVLGCNDKSTSEVAGTYRGKYFGGIETFSIAPGGSFTQVFEVKGKGLYTNAGTWTVNGRTVAFRNFMKAYWFTNTNFADFRNPIDFNARIPIGGANAIIFSDDADYFIRKE